MSLFERVGKLCKALAKVEAPPEPRLALAQWIRDTRARKAMSQEHLAEAAAISVRTVRRAETTGQAAAETLRAIAGALDEPLPDIHQAVMPEHKILIIASLVALAIAAMNWSPTGWLGAIAFYEAATTTRSRWQKAFLALFAGALVALGGGVFAWSRWRAAQIAAVATDSGGDPFPAAVDAMHSTHLGDLALVGALFGLAGIGAGILFRMGLLSRLRSQQVGFIVGAMGCLLAGFLPVALFVTGIVNRADRLLITVENIRVVEGQLKARAAADPAFDYDAEYAKIVLPMLKSGMVPGAGNMSP